MLKGITLFYGTERTEIWKKSDLTCPPKTDPEDELEYGLRMSMER
jgi:hypothetical protein